MTIPVFCYGSNLSVTRMRARAREARVAGVGRLAGHALRFHKRGRDGSAKADAFRTDAAEDFLWGVVYELADRDKRSLDRAEGLGVHYLEHEVDVEVEAGRLMRAWVYCASPDRIDVSLRPYSWYRHLVLDGARHHRLPAAYLEALGAVETVEDPDPERHARELAVLASFSELGRLA